jgi:large repetitive protein
VVAPTQAIVLSANYRDVGAGINAASVRLDVDQVNVSAQATISSSAISYARAIQFTDGEHAVKLSVKDLAGNETMSDWSFTVGGSPELTQPVPANGALLPFNSRPLIKINYQSKGLAVDAASLRFYFDAEDVTTGATLTATNAQSGTISFQPAQPLSSDGHSVYVELANASGAFGFSEWSFGVDAERIYSVVITAPQAATTVMVPQVEVLTTVLSNSDFPRQVTVNGVRGRYRSQVPGGLIYAATVPLVAGTNTLTASATFADGSTRTATRAVGYDAPPVVTITSPRDWETFGPATSINGAPVSGNASNLTGLVDRPISITGTVSKAVASVSINQQAATLSPDGKSFAFSNFFLREGTSLLSANATDSTGRIGTANITVFVDQTAPIITVENPANNAVTSASRIDVRGIANDAVEGGLGAAEPAVTIVNTANQQTITAAVSDRYYFATDVPLEVGANDLTVTATDQKNNAHTKMVRVVRLAVGSKRITLLGGNRQSAPVNSELPQALQISAIDAQGNPLANVPVRFDILRGNGSISLQSGAPTKPNGVNPARNLVVNTDNSGNAKVWLRVGSESSPGGNSVRAWSPEIAEDAMFTATGTCGTPHWVVIDGNASAQFVQTNTAPVDALQSVALDQNYNRMLATPVRYRILSGEAKFTANSAQNGVVSADGQSITVNTDKDGRASVRPIAGDNPGIVKIISEAVLPNNALAGQALFQLSVIERKSGPTKFRGVVMNHTGKPLAGVRLSIARTNLSVTSDQTGKFEFSDQVPPGKIDLFVDGRTVNPAPNIEYPALHFETAIIPGQDNQLPHAIYLPPVNVSNSQIVGGNQDVTLTIPGYEGFELIVKANSVTFPDGSHTGPLVVSPVHNDRLPMVPPGGSATFGTLGWTIQPTGTRFDPPAQVKIPNPGKMTAGQTASADDRLSNAYS